MPERQPEWPDAGTSFFGGPETTGPFDGLQAERARIPYAHTTCVKLPDEVADDDALLISDIFPTAWYSARLAEISDGDTVAVFGCGPVGMFAILSAQLQGAGRVFAVDQIRSRLQQARRTGAETVEFSAEDPVQTLKRLTGGPGPDRIIDAVGVDAESSLQERPEEVAENAPEQPSPQSPFRGPGGAPSQALRWEVEAIAKAGTLGIVGVYPPTDERFPIGLAMNKNLTVKMGNCNHRRYVPELIELVRSGAARPANLISQIDDLVDAIDGYRRFDQRADGWHKVALDPAGVA